MPAENREEYLEAIYSLNECKLDATTSQIAKHLQISSASVTQMLKKLDSEGLIRYKPYKGAKLTKKGAKLAKGLKRKHRLLERFLHDVLGIRKNKIHDEACKLEHGLSDEATDALDRVLGHPAYCPDDSKPIPQDDMVSKKLENSLMNMRSGETAKIIKLAGGKSAQSNLRNMGILEGENVKVITREPAGGPVVVKVANMKISIGRGLASKVVVST